MLHSPDVWFSRFFSGLVLAICWMLCRTQVTEELKEVRNCHASFGKGMLPGLVYTGENTLGNG